MGLLWIVQVPLWTVLQVPPWVRLQPDGMRSILSDDVRLKPDPQQSHSKRKRFGRSNNNTQASGIIHIALMRSRL